ncbi:unnamed protein product [Prorocentrum cordatum]|uniref:OST-HTH associated domain-containing protein n=1 Tax=Prorocentrum cordatum TaxID=2364126 RepID=A0ABN9UPM5_9DINO|nr:unnamed protein product [Polarella glacialis]
MAVPKRGALRQHQGEKVDLAAGQTNPSQQQTKQQPNGRRLPRKSAMIKPDLSMVTQAVESLYTDQLKPFGRLLRKRVAEHAIGVLDGTSPAARLPEQLPNVDAKHLETVCRTSAGFHVKSEEGGDWSVVIVGRSQPFVDIYCGSDVYPAELWAAAAAYFEGLPEEQMQLPGGRYSCAQALLRRRAPFLSGYTLGQACHIVELGIALHKILGYSNGSVVPYIFAAPSRW